MTIAAELYYFRFIGIYLHSPSFTIITQFVNKSLQPYLRARYQNKVVRIHQTIFKRCIKQRRISIKTNIAYIS